MRIESSGYLSRQEDIERARIPDRMYVFIFLIFIFFSFLG
jgi:hypothetical protein